MTLEEFAQYAYSLDSTPRFMFKGGRIIWEGVDYPKNASGSLLIVSRMQWEKGLFYLDTAYRRAEAIVQILPGMEEGEICNRNLCRGEMLFQRKEPCSCHINPPCSACVDASLICSNCGTESE